MEYLQYYAANNNEVKRINLIVDTSNNRIQREN